LGVGFFDGMTPNKFRGGDLRTRKKGERRGQSVNWSPNLLKKRVLTSYQRNLETILKKVLVITLCWFEVKPYF
jgi:hypothetical protein